MIHIKCQHTEPGIRIHFWERQKFTGARRHTAHSRFTNTHIHGSFTYWYSPCVCPVCLAPLPRPQALELLLGLPACWLVQLEVHGSLKYQHSPWTCPTPLSGSQALDFTGCLFVSSFSLKFSGLYTRTHPKHTRPGNPCTLALPWRAVPGTWALTHSPHSTVAPTSSHQCPPAASLGIHGVPAPWHTCKSVKM